jgi:dolichyl-diphosphooligosaccharide--protein glycosyltransferase
VDVVGAYTPPVIGALTVVPVYVLGRELFSRRAGLWAALIVGVLPGQILLRSSLGFTDHHCAETLLTTTALMWLVLALDRERPRRQRLRLSAAAGVTFGCYLLTWGGGSLFVVIVVASMAATLFVQRLRGEPAEDFAATLTPAFGIAALMIAPWVGTRPFFAYDVAALAAGLAGLVVLRAWGAATSSVRHGRLVYVAALAASLVLGLAIAWIARGGGAIWRTRSNASRHSALRVRDGSHAAVEVVSAVSPCRSGRSSPPACSSRYWAASGTCSGLARSHPPAAF